MQWHIECKRLNADAWETWSGALSRRVFNLIAREGLPNIPLQLEFEPRLPEFRRVERGEFGVTLGGGLPLPPAGLDLG